jgi:hypothetical protein
MQSNTTRGIVAVVGVALLVVLFFVFSGDDETGTDTTNLSTTTSSSGGDTTSSAGVTSTPAAKPVTIEIKDGEPVGGITDLTVDKGDDVDFIVDSDTASEVHVHGYDLMQDVGAGGKVEFDFPATIDGIFEIELEETATQIAQLTVNP